MEGRRREHSRKSFTSFNYLLLSFSILSILLFIQSAEGQNGTWNIRYHLNTATMYWTQQDSLSYTPPPSGCSAVQFNYLSRHGARYPSQGDINKFNSLSTTMQQNAQYYKPAYQWMGSWVNPYKLEDAELLTYLGQVELYNAAQRYSKLYYPLLSGKYKPYIYPMQSTQISRAGQSGTSFGYSLQQSNGHLPPYSGTFQPFFIYSDTPNEDFKLRFFDNCPLYSSEVDNNDTAILQATLFSDQYMVPLGIELSKQIGVYPHWNISASQLSSFYKACAYDLSIRNISDHFCALFNEEQSEILEYYNDLKDYYQKGYGYPINYEISCFLLKDFFNITDTFVLAGASDVKAKFRFAHAETHMPFVSLLGLYKDQTPLMANWSWDQINNREWRSSIISPFAANVQSILYQCPQSPSGYMLRFLVNEREMVMPMCTSVYCDYNQVKSYYDEALTCPFVEYCYPEDHNFCGEIPSF